MKPEHLRGDDLALQGIEVGQSSLLGLGRSGEGKAQSRHQGEGQSGDEGAVRTGEVSSHSVIVP